MAAWDKDIDTTPQGGGSPAWLKDLDASAVPGATTPASSPSPIEEAGSRIATLGAGIGKGVGNVALGAQRLVGKGAQALGAQQAGAWLVRDAEQGKQNLAQEFAPYRERNPTTGAVAELAGEVAGTLPVGGAIAVPFKALSRLAPGIAPLGEAISSAGLRTGANLGRTADIATRSAGGALTGGTSAALVNPESAGAGAAIGAALPPALKAAGAAGAAVRRGVIGQGSPEVNALAGRAEELGIQIPADRLTRSKPLDAAAAGLNYVPFSGRAAVEQRMTEQLDRALTRTFGQDSPNVTQALRKAQADLGSKFDATLKGNTVALDEKLLNDAAAVRNRAQRENALGGLDSVVDDIATFGATGQIDGQAAYNIKRTLDRMGRPDTPEAYHALEMKRVLMDALDRSLGPEKAAAFAETRRQYGNMLELEKLATNGAEGGLSTARVANLKHINAPDLQELADIAAQFLRPREGQHGAAQRAGVAGLTLGLSGPAALAVGAAAGRSTNAVLDSDAMRRLVLGQSAPPGALQRLAGRALPSSGRVLPLLPATSE